MNRKKLTGKTKRGISILVASVLLAAQIVPALPVRAEHNDLSAKTVQEQQDTGKAMDEEKEALPGEAGSPEEPEASPAPGEIQMPGEKTDPGSEKPAPKETEPTKEPKPAGEPTPGKEAEDIPDQAPQDVLDEGGRSSIRNEEDLKKVIQNPGGSYVLEADISLTGDILADVNFTGTLEGKGHRISGVQETIFGALTGALLNGIVIDGRLAETAKNTVIRNSGFYLYKHDTNWSGALLSKSENTTIENSFVFADLKGSRVAGFVLEGSAQIRNSYVSGSLQGETVYGFGKEVAVKESYIAASLKGNVRELFTTGTIEDSLYDVQLNDLEEPEARACFTEEMTRGDLKLSQFQEEKGSYPQIKEASGFQKEARKVSALSTLRVASTSNLSALKGEIQLNSSLLNQEAVSWSAEQVLLSENRASLAGEEGELVAAYDGMYKRYMLKAAKEEEVARAGGRTTEQTTQITYPVTMGKYYKVVKKGTDVPVPGSHEAAVGNGFKIMYWDGSFTQTGLNWNTEYDILSTDLTAMTKEGTLKTNYGKNGGKLILSGNYALGETMTAAVTDANTTKGTLYFERAGALDAEEWNIVDTVTLEGTNTASYTVTAQETNTYLRGRFVCDESTGYQGTLTVATKSIVQAAVESVSIVNKTSSSGVYTLQDRLVAEIAPAGKENEVIFSWYQEGAEERIAAGRNYTLQASDIGKKIYVKAAAKADGELKGEAQSEATGTVGTIQNQRPEASELLLVSTEDITATVQMQTDAGLYRYGIADTAGGAISPYALLSRAGTKTIITGLSPDRTYYIYVQHAGEGGYEDSEWSGDYLKIKTDNQHVSGDVVITGAPVYGQTLTAKVEKGLPNQTGSFFWYRLDSEGNREDASIASGETYRLVKEDIGKKLEAVYEASGAYAGETAAITETIEKEEKAGPDTNLSVTEASDTWITVQMPVNNEGETYIIGISPTKAGVPIEVLEGGQVKELSSGAAFQIKGLERDSTYFLFLRYGENDIHKKSEWMQADESVEAVTKKTVFTGTVVFGYDSAGQKLQQGQTLGAGLETTDGSFNYKGEWIWKRSVPGEAEEEIANFVLSDDKRGTTYVVPKDEPVGTTYKVSFSANVGYEGSTAEAISSPVEAVQLEPYETPNAADVTMEAVDDAGIRVSMREGEGLYQFWYKEADTTVIHTIKSFFSRLLRGEAEYTKAGSAVYSHTNVTITGLKRNTTYVVRVQRVSDAQGEASSFAYSETGGVSATTEKTSIAGHVTIRGSYRYNEPMTAVYNKAEYSSMGNGSDETGAWTWYRGTEKIIGAESASYTPIKEDVGSVLRAVYTMGPEEDFKGSVDAETSEIAKHLGSSPSVSQVTSSYNTTAKEIQVVLQGTQSKPGEQVYYRVQKEGTAAPGFPDTAEALSTWSEHTQASSVLSKDSDNNVFESKGSYVVYLIRMGTDTTENSSVITYPFTIGTLTQTGNITLLGKTHVGEELQAVLSNHNNVQGVWHWYYSKTDYTAANPTEWIEITDGFYPKINDAASTLSVPDIAKGRYIRVEFAAEGDSGYSGKIDSGKSPGTVTKTFDPKLVISGKGYTGQSIKMTAKNCEIDLTGRTITMQLQNGAGGILKNLTVNAISKDTFEAAVPDYGAGNEGMYISAVLTLNAQDKAVYRNPDGTTPDAIYLDKADRIQYHYGIPINTAADFANFVSGRSGYTNRGATYVLTDNIDCSGVAAVTPAVFLGTLNGDFHTIQNLKNLISADCSGATFKNMFIATGSLSNETQETGIFSSANSKNFTISQVYVVNFKLQGRFNTGLFAGKSNGRVIVERSGSAGGEVATRNANAPTSGPTGGGTLSGVLGFAYSDSTSSRSSMNDVAAINTALVNQAGGYKVDGCGAIWGGGNGSHNPFDINRVYVASPVDLPYIATSPNTKSGIIVGSLSNGDTLSNGFYDNDLIKNKGTGGMPFTNLAGTAKTTSTMVGTGLQGSLGSSVWTYKEGFYPRLKWILEDAAKTSPDVVNWYNVYAASKQAFVSVDGKTSSAQLAGGDIYGTIQLPDEFLKDGFSVKLLNPATGATVSNVLKMTESKVLVPIGTGAVRVQITYKGVSNNFDFTSRVVMASLSEVKISNDAVVGTALTAQSSNTGADYKWYRRRAGGSKTVINGAASQTYTPTFADAGYQLQVEVSRTNYATIVSNWSNEVELRAPSSGPVVTNITDNSLRITGAGGVNTNYEYAYSLEAAGDKVMIDQRGATIDVNLLKRNTTYYIFARTEAGAGYEASGWSPVTTVTTEKTDVSGTVRFGSNINNGSVLSINIPDTNLQTGEWTLQRIEAESDTEVASISIPSEDAKKYTLNYTLTDSDAGYRIKATFKGVGDFRDSKSAISEVVKKASQAAPSLQPLYHGSTDTSLKVGVSMSGTYDIGYAKSASDSIQVAHREISGNTQVDIIDLSRYTTYYVYARYSADAAREASPWSMASTFTTDKSAVSGPVTINGTQQVEKTLTFTVPGDNGQSGFWKLERLDSSNRANTISPEAYTAEAASLSYTVNPKDVGMKLRATFMGNGSFQGSVEQTSDSIQNAGQDTSDLPSGVTFSSIKDYSFGVKADDGGSVYQFGYTLQGAPSAPVPIEATGNAGTEITANDLSRNTAYDVYVRKAAKQGYDAGAWVKKGTVTTDRTGLTGTIDYVLVEGGADKPAKPGAANVNATYRAAYRSGTYAPTGTDTGGTWQWYANETPIPNATDAAYTIAPMTGNIEITVRYTAAEQSDFKGYRSAGIGTLTKPPFTPPALPVMTALAEDGNLGSKAEITTSDHEDVYFYVQKASNTAVPTTVTAHEAEENAAIADQWFKAEATTVLALEADTDYVVYAARLEDGSHVTSGVISQRPVRTEKEDLSRIPSVFITEGDTAMAWKVQQEKELRIGSAGSVPTGNWQYYVSRDKNASWQNVTNEIKQELVEGRGEDYAYTKVTMPSKYANEYYVRAVFTGRGAYEGTKTYVSGKSLAGTPIRGHVELTNSDQVSEIFVPIKVQYVYAQNETGADIEDEDNGIWTWYRETEPESGAYEKIEREKDTVGIRDEYRPTEADVNRKIYAVYSGAPKSIYAGRVQSSTLHNVERAEQNKPEAPEKKQVNGTAIQLRLPENYKTEGKTIPQPVVEYRKQGEGDWKRNDAGESWIGRGTDQLEANTIYEVRAQFEGTTEYKASAYSDTLETATKNQSFAEEAFSITQPTPLESGSKITAVFTGAGYGEGYFQVRDTAGNTLVAKEEGRVSGSSIQMDYTVTDASIGQNIIVRYQAKENAGTYGGYIEKNTREVVKPMHPSVPVSPELSKITLKEDRLKVQVDTTCEYVLDTASAAHNPSSVKWQKLKADTDGTYTFTGLEPDVAYYLHVRYGETAVYERGREAVSAAAQTWKRSQYTITYEGVEGAVNGDPSNPEAYTELSEAIILRDASKPGYHFRGWTTESVTEPQKGLTIPTHSSGDKTIKANWEIISYNLLTDLRGGTVSTANKTTYDVETPDFTLYNPTREGYRFTGWSQNEGEGNLLETVTISKGTIGDLSYTANWEPVSYNIIYHLAGGTNSSQNPQSYTVESNAITLGEPTRKGYTFEGFTGTDISGTSKAVTIPAGSVGEREYTAQWTAIEYTITYELSGGILAGANKERYTIETEDFTLENPTKSTYTFMGWSGTDIEDKEKTVTIAKGSTENRSYTANWELNQYEVTFDTHGGTAIASQRVRHGEKAERPEDPEKEGYVFSGWYREEAYTNPFNFGEDTVERETTIYGKFKLQLKEVVSSIRSGSSVEKGSRVELKTGHDAAIYYTTDGSDPTAASEKYTGGITVSETMRIKAIAIKEGCVDSVIREFHYLVKGGSQISTEGDVKTGTREDELIEAVVTPEEYQEYQKGADVSIRIICGETGREENESIREVLDKRVPGRFYDISVYKQIGNGPEVRVEKLNKTIRILLSVPKELLPKKGIERIFEVVRVHQGKAVLLRDQDQEESTVTIETDEFSTYILCYKDVNAPTPDPKETPDPKATPSPKGTPAPKGTPGPRARTTTGGGGTAERRSSAATGDSTDLLVWYTMLLASLSLGVYTVSRKKKYKK